MAKPKIEKQDLVNDALAIALESGIGSVSIRALATRADISIGAVYYYFPSKGALLNDLIAQYWRNALEPFFTAAQTATSFTTLVRSYFAGVQEELANSKIYDNVSLQLDDSKSKMAAKEGMPAFVEEINKAFLAVLERDERVDNNKFDDSFTREHFVHFVFHNVMSLLNNSHNDVELLIIIIERSVYKE